MKLGEFCSQAISQQLAPEGAIVLFKRNQTPKRPAVPADHTWEEWKELLTDYMTRGKSNDQTQL